MEKLVRDNIVDIITNLGKTPVGYYAERHELKQLLANKLVEEAKEFCEDKTEEELADVQEVIDAIYDAYGFSKKHILRVQNKKREERGAFKKGYVLENVQ